MQSKHPLDIWQEHYTNPFFFFLPLKTCVCDLLTKNHYQNWKKLWFYFSLKLGLHLVVYFLSSLSLEVFHNFHYPNLHHYNLVIIISLTRIHAHNQILHNNNKRTSHNLAILIYELHMLTTTFPIHYFQPTKLGLQRFKCFNKVLLKV